MAQDAPASVAASPGDKLLPAAEVATILNLSLTSVYRLARAGELRSHRLGKGKVRPRGLRIWESSALEYLRASEITPLAPQEVA
ncbi:hypothetical protein AAW14_06285 [Streptomyces hygroscopicus]|uniref:helix-turn-helix domain-containing protein n=1 Tax=Streptomyces hygroscopicus TaxID=1912 RepID=UPI00223F18E1|nr:helix-turn-helix domain-containing protein [Streptomyces hygroscopicus]MCW7941649.1 hypothetical protein [Streptomyces hygroscopicus]